LQLRFWTTRSPGPAIKQGVALEERRVRTHVEGQPSFSETAVSLSRQLYVSVQITRRVLDRLVEVKMLNRRSFEARIEPVYYRFLARASQVEVGAE